MSESFETYTCGEMTSTPSLSSKGVSLLDHLGEGSTYPSVSCYSQGGSSTSGPPTKERGMLTSKIHINAALGTTYSLKPNIAFVSLPFSDSAKHSTCFHKAIPSRQSLAPLAHALYGHPVTQHVWLSSILSLLDAIIHNT